MKQIVFAVALAIYSALTTAQESFSVEVVQEFQMPREQIFDNATIWLAESIRSSKAMIELKDKELGTIIGNASADLKIGWGATMPIQFKLRVDTKDNRYRLIFSQVKIVTNFGERPIEQANRESLEPKARDLFLDIAQSLLEHLTKSKKSATW